MKKEAKAFLQALLDAPSPSGYEGPARRIWCDSLKKVADELKVDVHGNAIATINPGGSPKVMLAGHIDELGFQICHIEKNGLMRFRTIGGHDLRTIAGRRIYIYTENGPILAVIGQQPIHLVRDKNRPVPQRVSDLWIDAGFANQKQAEKVIQIGDAATYIEGYAEINKNLAIARGFDNRAGAFVIAETLRSLKNIKTLKAQVSAVATVQEEIGIRGAKTSAFGVDPDVGIAVDVAWATDNPGGDPKEIGETKLGSGPVITRGPNVNPILFSMLKEASKKNKIPIQVRSASEATGTDANALQVTRAGVAAALVGIPNRYMHSPVEMCNLDDLDGAIKLLTATIKNMRPKDSFIPY